MHVTGKLLLLTLTAAGVFSGPQNELHDDREGKLREVSRSFKNYNHPPLFVSDTVDSEDTEVRKVRDTTGISDNPEKSSTLQKSTNNRGRATYVESSFPEKIPVTVVYDPEPIAQRDNKKLNNAKAKRRKQPKNSQPIDKDNKSEAITQENKVISETTAKNSDRENNSEVIPEEKKVIPETTAVVTDKIPSTSPSPRTVVPKVFTKRPPEFNPVFKNHGQREPVVKILENTNFVYSHSGNFHYSFEGGDGTKISSQGELKTFDNDATGEAVVGSVFYKDNEGNDFSLSYTADENGYRPHGDHLPTPPPIPPAIARALEYLATATSPEPVTKPTTSSEPVTKPTTSSEPITIPTTSYEPVTTTYIPLEN